MYSLYTEFPTKKEVNQILQDHSIGHCTEKKMYFLFLHSLK
jgi:hypothetical protein